LTGPSAPNGCGVGQKLIGVKISSVLKRNPAEGFADTQHRDWIVSTEGYLLPKLNSVVQATACKPITDRAQALFARQATQNKQHR